MHIKLNDDCYPIFIDEEACDVVDQLIFAADEAGYTPPNDQPIGEWAEDAALVILARYTTQLDKHWKVTLYPTPEEASQ